MNTNLKNVDLKKYGYHINEPEYQRRLALTRSLYEYGYTCTFNKLSTNITTNTATNIIYQKRTLDDINWLKTF
jgi:hypothetical protein